MRALPGLMFFCLMLFCVCETTTKSEEMSWVGNRQCRDMAVVKEEPLKILAFGYRLGFVDKGANTTGTDAYPCVV